MRHREIRHSTAIRIQRHLLSLAHDRRKMGYTKINEKKRLRLRSRVRWHLRRLRESLPRRHDCRSPTTSWKVREATEAEQQEAVALWNQIARFAAPPMRW